MVVKKNVALTMMSLLLWSSAGSAQVDVSTVSARIGTIRTLWRDGPPYEGHLWSLYPEVEIGGRFFARYLSWGASWGYWSDGISEPLPIKDIVTYSQTGHLLSIRIGFHPQLADEHWPIPVTVFGGFSHHIVKSKYISYMDFVGPRGLDSSENSTTAHVGLAVTVSIVDMFSLITEAQQFVPLGNSEIDQAQRDRRAFKIGVLVMF